MIAETCEKVKMVVVGEACVGKTALLARYLFNDFSSEYNFTVGLDFHSKNITTASGEVIRMQLWDTAGQERFRSLLPSYLRDCSAVLIVFDLTAKKTFEGIPFWVDYIRKHAVARTHIALVGNKNDLASRRQVSKQEAEMLAKKHELEYFETSAVNGDGVQTLFQTTSEAAFQVSKSKPHSVVGMSLDDPSYTSFNRVSGARSSDGPDKPFFRRCCH